VDPLKHSIPESKLAGSISAQAAIVGASPLATTGQDIQTESFITCPYHVFTKNLHGIYTKGIERTRGKSLTWKGGAR
jgi:hypothetical protein